MNPGGGGIFYRERGPSVDSEFDQAMQAIVEYQRLSSLQGNDELVCECHPVSYRQIAQYLRQEDNVDKELGVILQDLQVAQGCGTCLGRATGFIEAMVGLRGCEAKRGPGKTRQRS